MPSHRKRIGFLPSEEVHDIIERICRANEFSQSKVTGLLVEEALRSRGILNANFNKFTNPDNDFVNYFFKKESFSKNDKSLGNSDYFTINKKVLSNDIKMIHEFIEFKYFKRVMKQNKDVLE